MGTMTCPNRVIKGKKSMIGSKWGQLLWTVMRHLLNREKVRKDSLQNMKQMFQIFSYNGEKWEA